MIYRFGMITDHQQRVSADIHADNIEQALKTLHQRYPEAQYRIESYRKVSPPMTDLFCDECEAPMPESVPEYANEADKMLCERCFRLLMAESGEIGEIT